MINQSNKRYEDSAFISASSQGVFDYADDHRHFSSHMSQSSLMTGGGRMDIESDEGRGQKIGSRIR
ncbi:hypothetical protein A2Z53_02390 [Candidatus Giovannonibacteria bacterium RIFCSPHIGHO2_02_42_15]|uniref:Uncharacterized protein n=1 Tax=Candidatus Giovannonibacteria bacterium RIFCSPHIGHO2_02_42_15 TaxID=1798329 RepID=A0A1F5VPS4_9BACT|nr:MAG: hypothetical protein A2Z53_02390 [Candidatus Giovannonibacteria bacterium RIFCSPHIGHO2_02_42_15]